MWIMVELSNLAFSRGVRNPSGGIGRSNRGFLLRGAQAGVAGHVKVVCLSGTFTMVRQLAHVTISRSRFGFEHKSGCY